MAKIVAFTRINLGGPKPVEPGDPLEGLPKNVLESLRDQGRAGTEKEFEAQGGSPAATGALRDQVAQLRAALEGRDKQIAALDAKVAELEAKSDDGAGAGTGGDGDGKKTPGGQLAV